MEDNGWETIRSYNASVDTKNNNIKVSYYWDRSSSGTDEFIYDKNGNFTYMNKESQITNSTFNENNNLIKSVLTSPDGSEHITNFTYDNNDKSCKAISTEPNGDQYIYEYIRDKNGMWLLTKYVEYISTTNETKILAELTYDDNYKLIKENYQNSITTYTYNQKGNLIKKVDQTANGNTSTFDFTYDENDNLIRVISDKYIHEYTYDKNNNLIKIDITTIYDSGYEDKSTINYTYDNNGNVIKIDSNTDGIVTMDIEWKLFYIPHDNDNIESLLSSDYMYNMKPSW